MGVVVGVVVGGGMVLVLVVLEVVLVRIVLDKLEGITGGNVVVVVSIIL